MIFSILKKSLGKLIRSFFFVFLLTASVVCIFMRFRYLSTVPLIDTNWFFKEKCRGVHTEHVPFRNIALPVFVYSPHQVKFISRLVHMTLGCTIYVDALTWLSPLSLAPEDPKGMLANPQIPLSPLIFSTTYANGEELFSCLQKLKCDSFINE